MRLFHFTNAGNAAMILRDGRIVSHTASKVLHPEKVGAPMISQFDQIVDGLVWLTTLQTAKQAWQADAARAASIGGHPDFKHQVMFEVEVSSAVRWTTFAAHRGVPRWYKDLLAYKGTVPETWWVSEVEVPVAQWITVTFTESGEVFVPGRFDVALMEAEACWRATIVELMG